jgi:hypothetical protein
MEETNPWLDSEEVKHVNKPTVRSEKSYVKPPKKTYRKKQDSKKYENGDNNEEVVYISTIDKEKDVRKKTFLETLLNELDFLPEGSKKFAIETFGEKWLQDFLEHVKKVKDDYLKSNFFPSEDKMVLLKLILLLQNNQNN